MTGTLDRTALTVSEHVRALLRREATARRDGGLQSVAPAVELLSILALLVVVARTQSITALVVLGGVALAFAAVSHVPVRDLSRVVAPAAAVAAVAAAPRAVLVDGPSLVGPVTRPGAAAVAVLVLRVGVSAALVGVLLSTVRFPALLAGLRRLRAPATAVQLLAVTRRYLLTSAGLLAGRVRARRARRIESPSLRARWRSLGGLLGGFFLDAVRRGEAVQRSARARGGPGSVPRRDPPSLGVADAAFVAVVALAAVAGWLL